MTDDQLVKECKERLPEMCDAVSGLLEKGWHKGCSARNSRGEIVGPFDESAVSWCLYGAAQRASEDMYGGGSGRALCLYNLFAETWHDTHPKKKSFVEYNDAPKTTCEDVLASIKHMRKEILHARQEAPEASREEGA